jgi:hypothetical protein
VRALTDGACAGFRMEGSAGVRFLWHLKAAQVRARVCVCGCACGWAWIRAWAPWCVHVRLPERIRCWFSRTCRAAPCWRARRLAPMYALASINAVQTYADEHGF